MSTANEETSARSIKKIKRLRPVSKENVKCSNESTIEELDYSVKNSDAEWRQSSSDEDSFADKPWRKKPYQSSH